MLCLGPAHYITAEKAQSKDIQPSAAFVSATERLRTPPGVALVSGFRVGILHLNLIKLLATKKQLNLQMYTNKEEKHGRKLMNTLVASRPYSKETTKLL